MDWLRVIADRDAVQERDRAKVGHAGAIGRHGGMMV